jgi:hypothetical protein
LISPFEAVYPYDHKERASSGGKDHPIPWDQSFEIDSGTCNQKTGPVNYAGCRETVTALAEKDPRW